MQTHTEMWNFPSPAPVCSLSHYVSLCSVVMLTIQNNVNLLLNQLFSFPIIHHTGHTERAECGTVRVGVVHWTIGMFAQIEKSDMGKHEFSHACQSTFLPGNTHTRYIQNILHKVSG